MERGTKNCCSTSLFNLFKEMVELEKEIYLSLLVNDAAVFSSLISKKQILIERFNREKQGIGLERGSSDHSRKELLYMANQLSELQRKNKHLLISAQKSIKKLFSFFAEDPLPGYRAKGAETPPPVTKPFFIDHSS